MSDYLKEYDDFMKDFDRMVMTADGPKLVYGSKRTIRDNLQAHCIRVLIESDNPLEPLDLTKVDK